VTYTVERLHSCVAEVREAIFLLTYEATYVPELELWRHVVVDRKEVRRQSTDSTAELPLSA
jgi:hypothetical protein